MAVLMKEKIESKSLSQEKAKQDNIRKQISQAVNLRGTILLLENDCKDIIDTFNYCKMNNIRLSQPIRSMWNDYYDEIAFTPNGNFDIELETCCDFQNVGYDGKRFYIECVEHSNGHRDRISLASVDFTLHTEYYVSEAIKIMKGFVMAFPTFKANFMAQLEKALN